MRFHSALVIAAVLVVTACSQSRTSLPPTVQTAQQRRVLQPQASGLRPYGRDIMLTEYTGLGILAVGYGPYAVTGSQPDFSIYEYTFFISNSARDPTSNAIFFSNFQEDIDSADPTNGGRRYREIALPGGSDEAIQVAVDHHGAVYGLMGERVLTPSIIGYAKGNDGGIDVPPSTSLGGPKTGLTSRPFRYSMAFDETNELFVIGDGKIRIFAPPPNGDVPPTRTIEGTNVYPLLQGTTSFAVDQRGDVAVIQKTQTSVVLYRAGARGDALPVKTLSGLRTALTHAEFVVYCNNDALWVLDRLGARFGEGPERIMYYAPGWNGNTRPTRVIKLPLQTGEFVFDMTIY